MPNHHDIRQEVRADDREEQEHAPNDHHARPGLQRQQERIAAPPAPLRLVSTILRRNTPNIINTSKLVTFVLGDLGVNLLANLAVGGLSDPFWHSLAGQIRDGLDVASISVVGGTLLVKLIIDAWHSIRNSDDNEEADQ